MSTVLSGALVARSPVTREDEHGAVGSTGCEIARYAVEFEGINEDCTLRIGLS